MSGGHFDYYQYHIDDIIDSIEREIERATCERPPMVTRHGVSVWHTTEDGKCQWSDSSYYNQFADFAEAEKYFKALNHHKLVYKRQTEKGEWEMRLRDKYSDDLLEVRSFTYDEYERDEDGEVPYFPDYTEATLEEFRKGIAALKRARVYAHRIDWLISGDDGEDNFHETLKEELSELEESE